LVFKNKKSCENLVGYMERYLKKDTNGEKLRKKVITSAFYRRPQIDIIII